MSTFFALVLFADLAGGQTPSGYADSSFGSSELFDNMTATHGTGEVRVVVLAEVGNLLIECFALFIGHGVHTSFVFFMGAVTSSFGLPMVLYFLFFFVL